MSVVGIDFGSSSCTMAVVRRGGIDIVQNQVSSRQTSYDRPLDYHFIL